uniref:Charged multivesicular body protein 1B n=1 Tax=Anas zonorhyncha TaxID=75864 RepID=A0A8B9UIW1_9AVES
MVLWLGRTALPRTWVRSAKPVCSYPINYSVVLGRIQASKLHFHLLCSSVSLRANESGRVSESWQKHLFNLKFAAKELNRNSKKCDKEEKAEKAKIKKAIQKGNMEVARIHAENAIRQKNQAINFLRMSARVDAVAARVQTAVTMGKVTKSMAGVVKSMDATLKSMNLEKISALMDKFEHQFETLDVQTQQMEDTMSNTTTLTTPQNQVDMLLQEMADEAGLDLNMELPQGQTGSVGTSVASAEQDELSQRLARLRDQV